MRKVPQTKILRKNIFFYSHFETISIVYEGTCTVSAVCQWIWMQHIFTQSRQPDWFILRLLASVLTAVVVIMYVQISVTVMMICVVVIWVLVICVVVICIFWWYVYHGDKYVLVICVSCWYTYLGDMVIMVIYIVVIKAVSVTCQWVLITCM